jgi:hypothetical protein
MGTTSIIGVISSIIPCPVTPMALHRRVTPFYNH